MDDLSPKHSCLETPTQILGQFWIAWEDKPGTGEMIYFRDT